MLRCTFYRTFCAFVAGTLLVTDAWPLVANMVENTFAHNDALCYVDDDFYWAAPVRSTPMIVEQLSVTDRH